MTRAIALHKLDQTRPHNGKQDVQPTVCRTRSRDPLVFDQRRAAEILAETISGGYHLCKPCWNDQEEKEE